MSSANGIPNYFPIPRAVFSYGVAIGDGRNAVAAGLHLTGRVSAGVLTGTDAHVIGAIGEVAFAYWRGDDYTTVEVGDGPMRHADHAGYEVRSTVWPTGRLHGKEHDRPLRTFVLVRLHRLDDPIRFAAIDGWAHGTDLLRSEHYVHFKLGQPPGFYLPNALLQPIETLPDLQPVFAHTSEEPPKP
jgi:hypothetical protein